MNELKRYTLYIQNAADILSIVFSFVLSYALSFYILPGRAETRASIDPALYQQFLLLILLVYVVLNILFLYGDDSFLKRSHFSELIEVTKITAYIFVFMITYMFLLKVSDQYSRFFWILFSGIFILIDYLLRILAKTVLIPKISEGGFSESVLLVTTSKEAAPFLESYKTSKEWRYRISGIVLTDQDAKGTKIESVPVLANISTIEEDMDPADADTILLTAAINNEELTSSLIRRFQNLGKKVQIEINRYHLTDSVYKLDQVGNMPVLICSGLLPAARRSELFKRMIELLISVLVLPVFLLLTILYGLLLRIESPGSVFITRPCIGKGGRRYNQLRFRTFYSDADDRLQNNRRTFTFGGSVLRFFHLDGLPQIINILFHEISFVGPKQHLISEFPDLNDQDKKLLMLRPGIIGPWVLKDDESVSYFNDTSIGKDIILCLTCIAKYLLGQSKRNKEEDFLGKERPDFREYAESIRPFVIKTVYSSEKTFALGCYLFIKRLFDIAVSLAGIILLSPLFVILSALVIADDGGLPFYTQSRLGYQGKRIRIYKFRSMRTDAGNLDKFFTPEQKEQYLREFKLKDDPRITGIGKFLRLSSLDELPQLFNILNGDLSLVGPRPIVESETKYYGDEIGKLLSVLPGLTGYWQAYARNNATYKSGQRRLMELYYVDHRSILLDCRIILKTFGTVLSHEGAEGSSED